MSNKSILTSIIVLIILVVIVGLIFDWGRRGLDSLNPDQTPTAHNIGNSLEKVDLIQIISPKPNMAVTSPLLITGKARGQWYFEASFPVEIRDANGELLANASAQAAEDWLTTDFVPFSLELTFSKPKTANGTIIFRKDNPSGLSENDDSLYFPVSFE